MTPFFILLDNNASSIADIAFDFSMSKSTFL